MLRARAIAAEGRPADGLVKKTQGEERRNRHSTNLSPKRFLRLSPSSPLCTVRDSDCFAAFERDRGCVPLDDSWKELDTAPHTRAQNSTARCDVEQKTAAAGRPPSSMTTTTRIHRSLALLERSCSFSVSTFA